MPTWETSASPVSTTASPALVTFGSGVTFHQTSAPRRPATTNHTATTATSSAIPRRAGRDGAGAGPVASTAGLVIPGNPGRGGA